MCAGAIFWGNVRRVVFAFSDEEWRGIAGGSPENPVLALSCRDVFASGNREADVSGPHPDLHEQARAVHKDFWD